MFHVEHYKITYSNFRSDVPRGTFLNNDTTATIAHIASSITKG